jgi:glycosyltransferase involved in cell wall biosynthesis
MTPEISIVIPTYNRVRILMATLDSLFRQSIDAERFEIIVVDDGSTDGTYDALSELSKDSRVLLKRYSQKNMLSGSARNLGILKADAGVILSMDDDMIADPDLLKYHLNLHLRYPEVGVAVLGRVITGRTGVDLCDPDDRKISGSGFTAAGDLLVDPCYFTTQNVSVKKALIIDAGLFTPGLPRLDDLDLAFRLKDKGLRLVYCPKAVAVHRLPLDTLDKVVESGKRYGKTLADWYKTIPSFRSEIARFGARFDGGASHLVHEPVAYLKDAVRRWTVNTLTISLMLRLASKLQRSNAYGRLLTACCREIWAFYYRDEFRRRRS